jgi:hypothetical protein
MDFLCCGFCATQIEETPDLGKGGIEIWIEPKQSIKDFCVYSRISGYQH